MNRMKQIIQRKQRGARHGHVKKETPPVPESSGGDEQDPRLFPQAETQVEAEDEWDRVTDPASSPED